MIKRMLLLITILALTACSKKDSEADYRFNLMDSESIIAIAKDKAMVCKGHAMVDDLERAKECTTAYIDMIKEGSDYQIASSDVLKRIKADKNRLEEMQYKLLLANIDRVSKTTNYLTTYMESKNK